MRALVDGARLQGHPTGSRRCARVQVRAAGLGRQAVADPRRRQEAQLALADDGGRVDRQAELPQGAAHDRESVLAGRDEPAMRRRRGLLVGMDRQRIPGARIVEQRRGGDEAGRRPPCAAGRERLEIETLLLGVGSHGP